LPPSTKSGGNRRGYDAAAYRVHERSELIALDAAEAYISVIRFTRLIAISQDNVSAHRRISDNVQARFDGGRAGEGDLQQARERVASGGSRSCRVSPKPRGCARSLPQERRA